MQPSGTDQERVHRDAEAKAFAEAYRHHAGTLRNWFVAYGIGAPVLFLSNEKLWAKFAQTGHAKQIGALFLLGVAAQVSLALVDKYADWLCFIVLTKPETHQGRFHRAAEWWVEANWPSIALDFASLILFALATWIAFSVMT